MPCSKQGIYILKSINHENKRTIKSMEIFRKTKISKRYVRNTVHAKNVPLIKMQGEYLRHAGFKIGTECSVKIEQGRIIILAL